MRVAETDNYNGIDLLKYIMALAVVTIHNGAINVNFQYPPTIVFFIRSAVPFFFIVSGYFLARKLHQIKEPDKCRSFLHKRSKHLIIIFGVWLIIYLPIAIHYYVKQDFSFSHSVLHYCSSVVFQGESRDAWPLWFIYSLSIVTFLLSFTIKRKLKWLLILFSLIAYFSVYLSTYTDFNPYKIVSRTKFIFGRTLGGGIYILAGMYLYKFIYEKTIEIRSSWLIGLSMLPISVILFYYDLPFWELCSGLSFVMIGLGTTLNASTTLCKELRIQSMWIYYIHMYVITSMRNIFPDLLQNNFIIFIAGVYFISITLAYILYRIQLIPAYSKIGNLIK